MERCDEALDLCLHGPLQPPPLRLRLRAAWIEGQRGRLHAAIQITESVLAECPTHYGALNLLCDWLKDTGQLPQALAIAEKMIHVAPHEPEPLKLAAYLHRRQRQQAEAAKLLRRAFELDPTDEPTRRVLALILTDLAVANDDFKEAQDFLHQQQARRTSDVWLALEMRLFLHQGRSEFALARFLSLCRMQEAEDDWAIFDAVDHLAQHHGIPEVARLVKEALAPLQENAHCVRELPLHPFLGAVDIYIRFLRGDFGLPPYLFHLPQDTPFLIHCLHQYLASAAEACQQAINGSQPFPWLLPRRLRQLAQTFPSALATHRRLATAYAYALLQTGEYRALIQWLAQNQNPDESEACLRHHHLTALLACGEWEQARHALRQLLPMRLPPADHSNLLLVAALFHLRDGKPELAERCVAQVDGQALGESDQALLALAQTWLNLDSFGRPGSWSATRAVIRHLNQGLQGYSLFCHNKVVTNHYAEALRHWQRHQPWPWLRWWHHWRRFRWGWLLIPLLPVAAPWLWIFSERGRRWLYCHYCNCRW